MPSTEKCLQDDTRHPLKGQKNLTVPPSEEQDEEVAVHELHHEV